jgi:hypothetical protein
MFEKLYLLSMKDSQYSSPASLHKVFFQKKKTQNAPNNKKSSKKVNFICTNSSFYSLGSYFSGHGHQSGGRSPCHALSFNPKQKTIFTSKKGKAILNLAKYSRISL